VARLREGGIEVICPFLEGQAVGLDEAYHLFYRKGRPLVHLKWAQTLDGHVTAAHGRYLTGPAALDRVHRDRFLADALLVSAGTVVQDDPQLTVRLPGVSKQLVRVVVDRLGTLQPGGALFRSCPAEGPVWVVRPRGATCAPLPEREGLQILEADPDGRGGVDTESLLALLRDRGVMRLYIEAVGRLAWSFLGAGWVDRLSIHVAPMLRGGEEAPPPAAGAPKEGVSLEGARIEVVGADWIFEKELEGRCLPG
jgi:diaminohydroxyphosphoribosylaminopyrimidine deaminase/5-amino-6-(5-phosphoribosylamino)uracil reductase